MGDKALQNLFYDLYYSAVMLLQEFYLMMEEYWKKIKDIWLNT